MKVFNKDILVIKNNKDYLYKHVPCMPLIFKVHKFNWKVFYKHLFYISILLSKYIFSFNIFVISIPYRTKHYPCKLFRVMSSSHVFLLDSSFLFWSSWVVVIVLWPCVHVLILFISFHSFSCFCTKILLYKWGT